MRLIITTLFAWLAVVVACGPNHSPARQEGAGSPKGNTVVIPQNLIFTTTQGRGQYKDQVKWTDDDLERLEQIRAIIRKTGPSNGLLVSGDDLRAVVASTWQAYNPYGAGGADGQRVIAARDPDSLKLVPPRPDRRFGVWVMAYLGTGSSDDWALDRVERTGTKIRVAYTDRRLIHGIARVGDSMPHLLWAPLGPLDRGKYTVELYETTEKEVKLSRTVTLKE